MRALRHHAGERAARKSRSPGSFQVAFLDALGDLAELGAAEFEGLVQVERVGC